MAIFAHILVFLLSGAVIWFLSGILIDATDRVARRYNKPGFAVAFFVLGFLTSISEISVAVNATIDRVPQVSAGNLMGASIVIVLLIIPLLAVLGDGIPMVKALRPSSMALLLGIVALPPLLALDGAIAPAEGMIIILLYGVLIYRLRKKHPAEQEAAKAIHETEKILTHRHKATLLDGLKILGGAVLIFLAGNILVEESIYFAELLTIPVSFVGLLILSIGTNIPELVVAIRCILGRHKDIAFGDYMGSAAANAVILGFLSLVNGTFAIEVGEMVVTCIVTILGLSLFFVFSRSKRSLSKIEGLLLILLYVIFLLVQVINVMHVSSGMQQQEVLHSATSEGR